MPCTHRSWPWRVLRGPRPVRSRCTNLTPKPDRDRTPPRGRALLNPSLLYTRVTAVHWAIALTVLVSAPAGAQDPHAGHGSATPDSSWAWTWDAKVFAGLNYQRRAFTDFREFESQNWLMGAGTRATRGGRVGLRAMLSFEPFTVQALGSPQVFQTGETYQQAPLIDYQHPHDLFMGLGASYERTVGRARTFLEADLVGSPAVGPPVFMHRPSAAENPSASLSHHMLDSTHITPGVVTAGIERAGVTLEGSWFRGLEPDENRKDIDLGKLDSWALRGTWRRGPWIAQVSGAQLTTPEWVEPFYDAARLSASVAFTRADGRVAALLAWGQNREFHGNLDAYLFEATLRPRVRHAWYGRAEVVTKDILGAGGRHPRGFDHFHPMSRVGAFTAGYVHEAVVSKAGRFGLGGDATVYYVPPRAHQDSRQRGPAPPPVVQSHAFWLVG
jgi:hypothetical protein